MPDYNQLRTQLNQARTQKEAARLSLFKEKERLQKIIREKDSLRRIYDKKKKDHTARLKQLTDKEKSVRAGIDKLKSTYDQQAESVLGIFKKFEVFTDPRENIRLFDDSYPILLFPIRVETRFKTIKVENTQRHQLWIRVYPDDCMIDTFESVPSESEIENTRFYWSVLWQAGGHEGQERAAWRSLVSSHGSGRASWLIKNYVPENIADHPVKSNKEDVILVISVTELPPATDQPHILEFWKSYWRADGDAVQQDTAFDTLRSNVGNDAAELYLKTVIPDNLNQKPPVPFTKQDVSLDAVFLDFPASVNTDTKLQSWSQAPKTNVLPDRFVFIGYQGSNVSFEVVGNPVPSPLISGPDPSLEEEEQIRQENGEIVVNEEMKWMVDFDTAISNGMGIKIGIDDIQRKRGFDKIVVLGIRTSADKEESKLLLEELFEHHKNSRKGLSILPQGTPTNNTEKEGAGYKSLDDPDLSFDNLRKEKIFDLTADPLEKKDGQWLAESLGISDATIQNVLYSDGTDQREARAMNIALWPATLGYMMESLMDPVFNDNDIESTREFFNRLVTGRGTIPAIKIGKQPYGIYPTTAFSKIGWLRGRPTTNRANLNISAFLMKDNYLLRLYSILRKIDQEWTKDFFGKVPYVGKSGDAHQILLDAVGLTPQSVEFHQRYAHGYQELYNRLSFYQSTGAFNTLYTSRIFMHTGEALLRDLGYEGDEFPEILEKLFHRTQHLLKGPLIDDIPLSETAPIRDYTPQPDPHNYIRWLINAASTSHDALRKHEGFIDDKIPVALLFLMLRHALDLSFIDVSLRLHLEAQIMLPDQVRKAKIEPSFLHIAENVQQSESKWQYLYKKDDKITGDFAGDIGTYIPKVIHTKVAAAYLKEQLAALERLEQAPTARLERAFVEHIDLCSYRLDAWKNGFMNLQLQNMRKSESDEEGDLYKKGLYLGAYAILEDVRSENKVLNEVRSMEEDIRDSFLNSDTPLFEDSTNGGYIAAPSLNHAVTAAILRNGYMENSTKENPDLLSVNLSSERVRKALSVIEGIRGGQSLPELLGYKLERELHDNYPALELDFYIYELRRAFPLRANRLKDTKTSDDTAIEDVEARNVIDGLRLINHLKTLPANAVYPYGKNLSTDGLNQSILDAIKAEVNNIQDINDAISDVAISESVHQVVQGNYDRGVATLDTYSKGNFPPIPDIIQTPRSGVNITHRVGIHLESGVGINASPTSYPMTPRAKGEPALNKWLHTILPDPADIACLVNFTDFSDGLEKEEIITQEDLGIQPLDLLYLFDMDMEQAITQMDNLLIQFVRDQFTVRPDSEVRIKYMEKIPGKVSFFELSPLLGSIRSVVMNSRPLEPADVTRPTEERSESVSVLLLDKQRIEANRTILQGIMTNADTLHTTISALTDVETPDILQILNNIDSWTTNVLSRMKEALAFGNPNASLGIIHESTSGIFKLIINKIQKVIERWDNKLQRYDDQMDSLASATTDEEKISIMIRAEKEISTTSTTPIPATPVAYQALLDIKRANFVDRYDKLNDDVVHYAGTSIKTLYDNLVALLPLSDFDFEEVDITASENQILLLAENLASRVNSLKTDMEQRIGKVDTYLAEHAGSSDSGKQVQALQNAGTAIFGDNFKMYPEFSLSEDQGDEWANSFNDQAQLLDYSMNHEEVEFPVDNWLYGVSRVREKMHHLENIHFMHEAFGGTELDLQPVQLPYKPSDHWLALSYPEDYGKDEDDYIEGQEITRDKLLYTAYYSTPFNKSLNQCGILVDEWTELIPSKNETTGVVFHFDKPNSEPAQVMLLAMPSDFRGQWQWQDLVDIVHETLEMAKKRAIEPDQIDKSRYAWFLPATISSTTSRPITASLNYSFNNLVFNLINQDGN